MEEDIKNMLRKEIERCESHSCYQIIYSTAGGAGSGMSRFVNRFATELDPSLMRLHFAVLPSQNTIESPLDIYNTIGSAF